VIATEENQEGANLGREQEESVFRKDIRMKTATTIALPDSILVFKIIPVKRSEVDIGRGFINIDVAMGSPENAVNDECSERKHEGGKSAGMLDKLKGG
jgi:hypothetical protein